MNKSQAIQVLKIVKQSYKLRCRHCQTKRVYELKSNTADGRTKYFVTVSCNCGFDTFRDFGR